MSRALKQDDLLQLSKLYEAEFNQPDLHDRVLVFDVVASQVEGVSDIDEYKTTEAAGNESAAGRQDCGIDAKGANGYFSIYLWYITTKILKIFSVSDFVKFLTFYRFKYVIRNLSTTASTQKSGWQNDNYTMHFTDSQLLIDVLVTMAPVRKEGSFKY